MHTIDLDWYAPCTFPIAKAPRPNLWHKCRVANLLWAYLRNVPACHQPVYQLVGPDDVMIQAAVDLGISPKMPLLIACTAQPGPPLPAARTRLRIPLSPFGYRVSSVSGQARVCDGLTPY